MRNTSLVTLLATGSVTLLVAALGACGSASGGGDPVGSGAGGGASGSGGSMLTGGSGGSMMTGGSGGGTGGFLDGGPEGGGGMEGCATASYDGDPVPVDIYVMLDKSGSMSVPANETGPAPWGEVTNAITEFMAMPGTEGLGMGIGFFPIPPSIPAPTQCSKPEDCLPYSLECFFNQCMSNMMEEDSCLSQDYRNPAVPINLLPGVAGAISNAMSQADPGGMTPMAPALWGALEYAGQWKTEHPDHVTLVVLATDGYPTHCEPGDIEDVAAIAEGAATQHDLRTFVIGIGLELENLNMIAEKGGTGQAIMVDTGNAGSEFLAALNQIRGSIGCIYEMPEPEEGEVDTNMVNVEFTPEGGTAEVYPYVETKEACGTDKGWYYDNPTAPEQIILCPASCDQIQQVAGVIDIVVGCQTIVK